MSATTIDSKKIGASYAVPILLLVSVLVSSEFLFNRIDDAFIHFRIASNFHYFGTLNYNLDENILATTSPLWATLISFLFFFLDRENAFIGANILYFAFLLLTSLNLLFVEGRKISLFAFAVALIVVSNKAFYLCSGLETGLMLFLITAAIFAHLKRKYLLSGVLCGLGALARGDVLLLCPLLCALIPIASRVWVKKVIVFLIGFLVIV